MPTIPPGLTLRPSLVRPGAPGSIALVPGHLSVALTVQEGDLIRPVLEGDLVVWHATLDALIPPALDQLRADSPKSRWQPVSSVPGLRLFLSSDGQSATRMLILDHLLHSWPLGGVVVACPSEDQFLCVPLDAVEDLEAIHVLATATRFAHQVARNPLSDQVFWNGGARWVHLGVHHGDTAVEIRPPPAFLETVGRLAALDLAGSAAEA